MKKLRRGPLVRVLSALVVSSAAWLAIATSAGAEDDGAMERDGVSKLAFEAQREARALRAKLAKRTDAQVKEAERRIAAEIQGQRQGLEIAATQRHGGQTFDWIDPASQPLKGPGALPPPLWELMGMKKSDVVPPAAQAMRDEIDKVMVGPDGKVPLWRPDAAHMARRSRSYDEFMRGVPTPLPVCQELPSGPACRYYARIAATSADPAAPIWGTVGGLNVWKPTVDPGEVAPMSLMQTAIKRNGADGLRDTIELGWMVNPDLFDDDEVHLFTYITPDGYDTSCYNGTLAGDCAASWWQASSTITPGMVLGPVSTTGGDQFEATVGILAVPGWYLVWWLDQWIGAVPAQFFDPTAGMTFDGLAGGADDARWYGETVEEVDGVATATDMGGGEFVSAGFGHYAFIRNMMTTYDLVPPGGSPTWVKFYDAPNTNSDYVTDSKCYDMATGSSNDGFWNDWIIMGGPGYNEPDCTEDE